MIEPERTSGRIADRRYVSAMHRVVVPVPPGAPVFELAVPCEVFGRDRCDVVPDWYGFRLCRTETAARTELPHGLSFDGDAGPEALATADTVIVPAWPDPVGATAPDDLIVALQAAHARGARIASICSGAFVLAQAGLLDGRRATTHWCYAEALAARFPRVRVEPDVLYIDEGDLLTSAGTAAGLDLCLHIIRRDHGARAAAEIARRLVVAPHREGGQAQFVRADLAERAAMSPRTFARAFVAAVGMPPMRWLSRRRVAAAQELLETTALSVEQVAARVGYGSAVSLRTQFGAVAGTAPTRYRRTFAR
jgi:transcriptional regulator GlxA family with amidase domain